jgi:hypothetical protein
MNPNKLLFFNFLFNEVAEFSGAAGGFCCRSLNWAQIYFQFNATKSIHAKICDQCRLARKNDRKTAAARSLRASFPSSL